MAITQAPFLSLGAKGAVAKTLVASTWKGIKTMRHYVTPANPKSTAQVAQRNIMSAVVAFWKSSATAEATVSAWNKLALVSGKAQSGFNAFTSNMAKLAGIGVYPTMFWDPSTGVPGTITMKLLNDTSVGSAAPNSYKLFVGSTENKLYDRDSGVEFDGNRVTITYAPATGDKFFKLVANKTGVETDYEITGIWDVPV